ncbi:MAG: hypothetical protein WAM14_22040 [Candidatus Nitrosopolaris sp.]
MPQLIGINFRAISPGKNNKLPHEDRAGSIFYDSTFILYRKGYFPDYPTHKAYEQISNAGTTSYQKLRIASVIAIGIDGNVPANVLENNLNIGIGSFIRLIWFAVWILLGIG